MIDENGFRAGVGVIIINEQNRIFWARRIGHNGWQFPQGGIADGETPLEAMYRELFEEIGLCKEDVEVLAETRRWLYYYLPKHLIRQHITPLCIGQRQKWFLLRLRCDENKFCFNCTDTPEFDGFRWVSYWFPLRQVVFFKKSLYRRALREFAPMVFDGELKQDSSVLARYDEEEESTYNR